MPKELDMVKMTPVKSKTTDFQQLCIHGSWEDVQRYLTDWRKTRVAELAGAFVSDTEKYRPYDGLVDAFRHGRLNIVKGLLGEGLSLQSDRDCNFALAAAAGAVRTGSSEILEFLLDQGWDPNHQDMPPLAGESYIQPQYSPIS
jgi:hypothetical protein